MTSTNRKDLCYHHESRPYRPTGEGRAGERGGGARMGQLSFNWNKGGHKVSKDSNKKIPPTAPHFYK